MRCPSVIVEYQTHMDGIDMGNKHRVVGAGFANVAHLKKIVQEIIHEDCGC